MNMRTEMEASADLLLPTAGHAGATSESLLKASGPRLGLKSFFQSGLHKTYSRHQGLAPRASMPTDSLCNRLAIWCMTVEPGRATPALCIAIKDILSMNNMYQ